eukprot:m.177903 g.177903  ORF g.177903 m.177903 type:complete len:51 (+) comp18384_c0_seq3:1312-1464(+)
MRQSTIQGSTVQVLTQGLCESYALCSRQYSPCMTPMRTLSFVLITAILYW